MQDRNIWLDDLHLENGTAYIERSWSGSIFCLPQPLFEDGHKEERQDDSEINVKELLG
jgi:hypothetical protein